MLQAFFERLKTKLSAFVTTSAERRTGIHLEPETAGRRLSRHPRRYDEKPFSRQHRLPAVSFKVAAIECRLPTELAGSIGPLHHHHLRDRFLFEENAQTVSFLDDAARSTFPKIGDYAIFVSTGCYKYGPQRLV